MSSSHVQYIALQFEVTLHYYYKNMLSNEGQFILSSTIYLTYLYKPMHQPFKSQAWAATDLPETTDKL